MKKHGMLFVQGKDRPGIIEKISGILFSAGANLEDVSMTLLEGQFAMMLSFEIENLKWGRLKNKTSVLKSKPWFLNVDLILIARSIQKKKKSEKSILISAIGKDRTGIVHRLSSGLAKMKANITNLDCRLLQRTKKNHLYSLALEVDLAKNSDLKKIKNVVRSWESELGVEVKIHSSESAIF